MMILNKQLKTLLEKHDISIAKLSRATGVNSKTLYQWSSGANPKDLNQLKKVADFFNVSIDTLIFGKTTSNELELYFSEINIGNYEVILRKIKTK